MAPAEPVLTQAEREEVLAREIAGTVLDGIHSEPLEYVLRRGYADMALPPNLAAEMCRKLAACQIEEQDAARAREEGRAETWHRACEAQREKDIVAVQYMREGYQREGSRNEASAAGRVAEFLKYAPLAPCPEPEAAAPAAGGGEREERCPVCGQYVDVDWPAACRAEQCPY